MSYKKAVGRISEEFEHYYKVSRVLPERRFLAAMLERAILDYLFCDRVPNTNTLLRGINEEDARRWFYAKVAIDSAHPLMSFCGVCEALGIDRKDIIKHIELAKKSIVDGVIEHFSELHGSTKTQKTLDKKGE